MSDRLAGAGVASGKTISNTSIVALGLETAGAAGVVAAGATLAFGASPRAAGIAALIGAAVGGAFGSLAGPPDQGQLPQRLICVGAPSVGR